MKLRYPSGERAVLPAGLAGRLDLDRLTRVPASFVDEALKWRYSDLLFTAPLDGRDAFVYLLVEHQSSADPLMAFRMLRYVTRIWDHHLRDHPRAGNPRITAELRPWAGQLRAVLDQPGGGEAFIAILTYIELVSEAPASELRDLAASLGPDAEEAYVTTAEMLHAEGEARGEARWRAEALVQVLTVKFGPLPESVSQTVHGASSDRIQAWTARAVTAETLHQVFD